jgi:hypothetical protein
MKTARQGGCGKEMLARPGVETEMRVGLEGESEKLGPVVDRALGGAHERECKRGSFDGVALGDAGDVVRVGDGHGDARRPPVGRCAGGQPEIEDEGAGGAEAVEMGLKRVVEQEIASADAIPAVIASLLITAGEDNREITGGVKMAAEYDVGRVCLPLVVERFAHRKIVS